MTLNELIKRINELIEAEPYKREDVIALLTEKEELTDNEILMLGAALEYARKYDDPHAEHIRGLYDRKLEQLKEYYSRP